MPINLRLVKDRKDLERFIRCPLHLADRRPNQVPPLLADERELHDAQRNLGSKDCEVAHWLAERDGHVVGRVMGIIHGPYNQRNGERVARFFQLDAVNDRDVVRALLDQVETWARDRGMDRIIGPYGFSDKDPQGFQVEGFDHLPVLATPTNAEHLPLATEACGYRPYADALSYRLDLPTQVPDVYDRIADRVLRSGRFKVVDLRSKSDLRPWILPVLRLVNDTYDDLLGFAPMSEAEMRKLADQYMPVLDPALVKIVADGREPVAFVVAMPDMSEGLRRAKGRLFPFGWWHIMQAMKRSTQMDLFLGAVRKDLQGIGLTCVLGRELFREGRARGMTHLDSHLVLETNVRMRAELERLGGVVWKRYRVYVKEL